MTVDRREFLLGCAAVATGIVAAACSGDDGSSSAASTSALPSSSTSTSSTTAPLPTVPTGYVTTGPTTTNRVALTFHTSGELALADELLAVLAAGAATMTAFIVGEWLEANPGFAARLLDAGHELANHTYNHPSDFTTLPIDAMTAEIQQCRDVIAGLSGSPGAYFRPSGTADGTAPLPQTVLDVAAASGYPTVLGFDNDPFDYQDPGADAITARVLDTVRAGSIISLHFDHPGTIEAVPAILSGLAQRGLRPGTATALLSGT